MFINVSNHPHEKWSKAQLDAAIERSGDGIVKSFPHPKIDPHMSSANVYELAANFLLRIIDEVSPDQDTVFHIMGEQTFVNCLMHQIKEDVFPDAKFVVSTTDRVTVELPDGNKISKFEFVQFRDLV